MKAGVDLPDTCGDCDLADTGGDGWDDLGSGDDLGGGDDLDGGEDLDVVAGDV